VQIKHVDEDTGQIKDNVWEFQHPNFQAGGKSDLDSIKVSYDQPVGRTKSSFSSGKRWCQRRQAEAMVEGMSGTPWTKMKLPLGTA
jgi:hypothetical protein